MYGKRMREEVSMQGNTEPTKERWLSFSEAVGRAQKAVNFLEEEINRVDETLGKRDEERHTYLTSLFMSFMWEQYGIAPSSITIGDTDNA